MTTRIQAPGWYETIPMGDDVTLIHEPWIKPFFRCNMWHVRGRDRDLLFDSGLGHVSLRAHVAMVSERPPLCVASHTHFDHIGCHHEFADRAVHGAEAHILADPRTDWTLADRYATDDMFIAPPEGWEHPATGSSRRRPAAYLATAMSSISATAPSGHPHARPFAGRHRALRDEDRNLPLGRHHL